MAFSFCRPSRGPTSTMRHATGQSPCQASSDDDQHGVGLDLIADGARTFGDAPSRGALRWLHLHRFDHDQRLAPTSAPGCASTTMTRPGIGAMHAFAARSLGASAGDSGSTGAGDGCRRRGTRACPPRAGRWWR